MKRHARDAALRTGLRRLLAQLVEQARHDLEAITQHPEKSVHDFRTRMKKFAAVLRLVKRAVPRDAHQRLLGEARALKNAFTAQREAHVAANLHEKFSVNITRHLNVRTRWKHQPVFRALAELEEDLTGLTLGKLKARDVLHAYLRSYRKGRRCLQSCCKRATPEQLHKWRKQVKRLHYESLALRAAGCGMDRRIRRSHKLGHLLGEDHDLHLAAQHSPAARPALASKLEAERRRMKAGIIRRGRALYRLTPARLKRRLT